MGFSIYFMMKLLLESWKSYLNEELLLESYDDTYRSLSKKASNLVKGWAFDHDKEAYEEISSIENAWDLCGRLLVFSYLKLCIPNDIEEKQQSISLLWVYRQFVSNKISSNTDACIKSVVEEVRSSIKKKFIVSRTFFEKNHNFWTTVDSLFTKPENRKLRREFELLFIDPSVNNEDYRHFRIPEDKRPKMIPKLFENFFQWNRFIRDGKKDLNSVDNFEELAMLVGEAESKYGAWLYKQESKDAEKGKELLFDDQNYQVIAIHNKGAACELGKPTNWCTASPGLQYFEKYYKPNDPLFYILDKFDGEMYQFHFGSEQFMDKNDIPLYPSRYHIGDAIMEVLAKVVTKKYDIAYNYLARYR